MELKHFSKDGDPQIDWVNVDMNALQMLDNAREISGVPYQITSNHRTAEEDMALAGFTGAHVEIPCTAFDIYCPNATMAHAILRGCFAAGFPRVGYNAKNGHVHVDCSKVLPNNVFWIE